MHKKFMSFISILMVLIMMFASASCNIGMPNNSAADKADTPAESEENTNSNQLEILKSDFKFSPEETLSQIKAEYLISNKGYSDGDEIVAILALDDKSLIESYNAAKGVRVSSVSEFAHTDAGKSVVSALTEKQERLIKTLTGKRLISGVEYKYTTIANAIAVNTTYGNFKKIEKLTGVGIRQAALSDTFSRPKVAENDGRVTNVVDVYETGIYKSDVVSGQGITGKGTAVAVLDSGFDTSHSVFQYQPDVAYENLLFTKEKIEAKISDTEHVMNAAETTPGLIVDNVYYSEKIPYAYDYADKDYDVFPYDSEHGTHVAGIIGGKAASYTDKDGNLETDSKGNPLPFLGVAVDTQLVLMKVFPDLQSGAHSEDILAALEDAVLLGVDAINMSLGSSCGFAREPDGDIINTVYDSIYDSGISLVTAASNDYTSGYGGPQGNTSFVTNPDSGTVGAPSTYAAALSVASISGTLSNFIFANGTDIIYFLESNSIDGKQNHFFDDLFEDIETKGAKYAFGDNRYNGLNVTTDGEGNKSIELEYVTVPGIGDRNSYRNVNVMGKVALVRRGDNSFEDKALQAKNAGAIACIIYNNIDGDIAMSMGKTAHVPTVSISKDDGTALASRSTGKIVIAHSNAAGPFMSDFSSWGPMPSLELKPEITAHGGNIRSSVPGGGFDDLSGTSMASPNMCGVVVLIRQYLKGIYSLETTTWKDISVLTNAALMSTATIANNEEGNPYSPRKQGAGLASISNVVNTKGFITVDGKDRPKLELGDDPVRKGVYEMEFNVVNMKGSAVSYDLSLVGMTESVSTSDVTHIAEKSHLLSNNNVTVKYVSGDGSVSGNRITVNGSSDTADPAKLNSVKIRVTYTLTQADKDYIDERFPYGMYVEGFVKLKEVDDNNADTVEVDLNAPFLAFYGDWTQAPVFDRTYYEVESEAHNGGIDEEDKIKEEYYATIPLGSYLANYGIQLGSYVYSIDTSRYDPIPASEEHIALSDDWGSIDGMYAIFAGCFRDSKYMRYTITDKTSGEVLYEYLDKNVLKSYAYGGTPYPSYEMLNLKSEELGLVNNRQYEFKMQAYLDYDLKLDADGNPIGGGGLNTNVRNYFKFDFTMDNEAPALRKATFEKEYDRTLKKDRFYINLTVYDNHYVQCVYPLIFTETSYTYLSEYPIPVYGERGRDATVRFEITDVLNDSFFNSDYHGSIAFSVMDYALNGNIYLVQLPGSNGSLKFTDDGTTSGTTMQLVNIAEGEIRDLTQYLSSADLKLDADKDYLKYLTWTSDNPSIARVERGQVLGVSTGMTNINVTSILSQRSATIRVFVRARSTATAATGGIVNDSGSVALPLAADFDNVANERIEEIRFVYFDTLEAHLEAGEYSDIGTATDRSRTFISSTGGAVSFYPGESIKLTYEIKPWYVADKYKVTFSSSNRTVATVDENGVIRGLKEGTARITASVENSNLQATLYVTIKSEFIIENRILVSYKGVGGDVVIPDDEGILYIGPYAFSLYTIDEEMPLPDDDPYANRTPSENYTVTSVTIPAGVQEIQQYAFYGCHNLQSVNFTDDVKFIRTGAFENCEKLEKINYGNGKNSLLKTQAVGSRAFANGESLTQLDLSKTLSIGIEAFADSALTSVDLTALRNTGAYAFAGCKELASIKLDLNGNTKLAEGMFMSCTKLTSLDIYSKTGIPAYCFGGCTNLTAVTVHSIGSPQIGAMAFAYTGITEITLPGELIDFGSKVFEGCTALATVKLQAGTEIRNVNEAFAGTGVTKFEVASGNNLYTAAENGAMLVKGDTILLAAPGHSFGELTITAAYARVGESAFAGADITKLIIDNPNLVIEDYAFAGCSKLTGVQFPAQGNIFVGDHAFVSTALSSVENFESVKTIGNYAFMNAKITEVNIGENADVGEGAFYGSALQTVTVGKNAVIGRRAFYGSTALTAVNMPSEGGVTLYSYAFAQCKALATIDLSRVEIIPAYAFFGCSELAEADLSSATKIEDYAFALCRSLAQIKNLEKVTAIGNYAFAGNIRTNGNTVTVTEAPAFTAIALPATLKTIGEYAFAGSSLTSIAIPSGVVGLGDYAFAFSSALATVTLPDTLKKIGDFTFSGCTALTTVNLGKVEEIGLGAFAGNSRLSTVDLTSAVKIGDLAFYGSSLGGAITANNLTEVGSGTFEGTAITAFNASKLAIIGDYAFSRTNLTGFVFSNKLTHVGIGAFLGCSNLASFYKLDGTMQVINGEISAYALLDSGILYTRMPNGRLQLSSVPAKKNIPTLEVLDGTYRIQFYAGNENTNISKIILPDTLASIENFAFYGYTSLKTVEFKSAVAPALENYYDGADVSLEPNDPGYNLVHGAFEFSNLLLYMNYYTFIDLMGTKAPIAMILPANGNIEGYDSLVYLVYFGEISAAQRSTYVAMEKNMKIFIECATEISKIEIISLNNEDLVNRAATALNAITQNYADYGYTAEQWNALIKCVNDASSAIKQIKAANMSKVAKDVQARINSLPDEYDGSAEQKAMFEELMLAVNSLRIKSDIDALDLTKYNAFRASYESYNANHNGNTDPGHKPEPPEDDDPPEPDDPPVGGCGGCGSTTIEGGMIIGGGTLLVIGLMLAVAHFVRRKKVN